MARTLMVCPSCTTHVLVGDATCPHCGVALPSSGAVTRTAGALLMGLALAGCPADDTDKNGTTAAYGVPTTGDESDSLSTTSSSSGDDTSSSGASSSTGPGDTDTDTDGTSTGLSPDYGVPTTGG